MKLPHIFLILTCLPLHVSNMTGQSYRVLYSWEYKDDKNMTGYYNDNMDMMLDISNGKGVFYNKNTYERDSLYLLAFDRNENIQDDEIYGALTHMTSMGTDNVTFTDYSTMTCCLSYMFAPSINIIGDARLELPKWNISDETTVSREGYNCRKATANYMGREWIVWFTEEIPLPYGPWLLWGTPGLIIMAFDSEKLFLYRFMGIEELKKTERYLHLWNWRHTRYFKHDKFYNYNLENAEKMYTKLETDEDYEALMTGASEPIIVKDKNGNIEYKPTKYIPLIPPEYWK